jgi:hypothetical protein
MESTMKGKDLIAVLEYGRAFDKQKKTRRRRKEKPMKDWDNIPEEVLFMKLDRAERVADQIKQYIEQRAKMYKKEDKKEEPKGWAKYSFIQKVTILTGVVPIAMMAYMLLIVVFLKLAARVMGFG